MARKLKTKNGRAVYSRRKAIVEPVFGQIDTVQNGRKLHIRGKQAAREQWRFTCAVHNLLKLHRAGGLKLIEAPNSTPPGPSTLKPHPLATVSGSLLRFAASLRRTLREPTVWNASPAVTAPRS
jgi:hypothetical protein